MAIDKYSAIIETILFYENDVVKKDRLIKITGLTESKLEEIIINLTNEYSKDCHGLKIIEIADGYTFAVKDEIYNQIKEHYNIKPKNKLSKSVLTVLSIIAYKQPVTKNEIEKVRGVSSDNAVRKLIELEYIEIKGRKEVLGKPLMYGTTELFLKHFNLKNLEDLPEVGELKSEEFSLK